MTQWCESLGHNLTGGEIMAVDITEIKDMSIEDVIDMISTFKLEELASENRSDALTALSEAFSFIIKHTDKEKSDEFVGKFIEKFNEIKMEMETGEKTEDESDEVESPTEEEQSNDKLSDPFVTPEKGQSGNSFSDLINKASNFM